ncbi:MAG TPA: hypothetical protein VE870_12945, partial [Bacteroidales bacterium]|nr:hypothetical protein [Bacteroidales bacterium]
MKYERREFIKQMMIAGSVPAVIIPFNDSEGEASNGNIGWGSVLSYGKPLNSLYFCPLERLTIRSAKAGKLVLVDAHGIVYHEVGIDKQAEVVIGGALGNQLLILEDKKGRLLDALSIPVNATTELQDDDQEFAKLLDTLYRTMTSSTYGLGRRVFYNGKYYTYFSSWFQDHVYNMKGMKYFSPEWKSGVDLYADGQREDGMIHDNYKHKYEHGGPWSWRFDYGNFVYVPEDP